MDKYEIKKGIDEIVEALIGFSIDQSESLHENGVDSLLIVSLIVAIEEKFNVTFSDEDLQPEALKTIEDIILLTEKYVV